MIVLKKSDYEKIIEHAKVNRPEEACGLIAGNIVDGKNIVEEVYLLENIDHTNEHFSMDPAEQFKVLKDIRAKGYVQFGNFHSHPETPSRPSNEDKRLAYDSKASYLILSLMDIENPVLNSFKISGDEVEIEEIEIV